jgi:hypothetical protein
MARERLRVRELSKRLSEKFTQRDLVIRGFE